MKKTKSSKKIVLKIIMSMTGPQPQEGLPVQEEVIEDDAGVISSVIVPTLTPVAEDAMEEESDSAVEVPI